MIAFTQEELQRIADTDHVQSGDASAIARMLLASLNATPIYQVQYGQQWRDVSKERYEDHRDHGSPTRIVYAEPPAPVEQSPELIDYEHRMICGELRPVPKFRVEETYHNMLKEEQEVNAKLAEYSLNKSLPQPTPESEDRKMLKRLAVIMSGNDAPGEIRSLTVTAQSLVDRCKALAWEKENSHIQWKPASTDEIDKRSVREPTTTFPPAKGPQIPPMASSQTAYIALHSPKLPVEVLAAIKEVVRIRLDFNEFDGDRRGIGDCLERAEQELIEIINKNAALLDKEIA
ncbi:hypothetical protein C2920_21695 [Salmonella enterica]|nr:hypothetical protein [Salmonella enterica]